MIHSPTQALLPMVEDITLAEWCRRKRGLSFKRIADDTRLHPQTVRAALEGKSVHASNRHILAQYLGLTDLGFGWGVRVEMAPTVLDFEGVGRDDLVSRLFIRQNPER